MKQTIKCRKCNKSTRTTMIQSNKGHHVGYSCKCGETVTLTKAYPTASEAKSAWNNR